MAKTYIGYQVQGKKRNTGKFIEYDVPLGFEKRTIWIDEAGVEFIQLRGSIKKLDTLIDTLNENHRYYKILSSKIYK